MLLSELKEKQSAVITSADCGGAFGIRLSDMGFREGERVLCVKRGLLSSPILYSVNGSFVAIRKKDASKIEVVL
jgi:Fe2+ transport system protein FeoA